MWNSLICALWVNPNCSMSHDRQEGRRGKIFCLSLVSGLHESSLHALRFPVPFINLQTLCLLQTCLARELTDPPPRVSTTFQRVTPPRPPPPPPPQASLSPSLHRVLRTDLQTAICYLTYFRGSIDRFQCLPRKKRIPLQID